MQSIPDITPFAVALSIRGNNFDFNGVAGEADSSTMDSLTREHRFHLASVGKTCIGVATAIAESQSQLSLDDTLIAWPPAGVTDRIPSSDAITVRNLLNHTSGLYDFQNDGVACNEALLSQPGRAWKDTDALPFFLDKPLHF